MKDFWKMLLAVICGLLIFGFIAIFFMSSVLGAMTAATQGKTPVLPRSGVLAIDMSSFALVEKENQMPNFRNGSNIQTVSLYKAVKALETAATDPGVQYIAPTETFLRLPISKSSARRFPISAAAAASLCWPI